GPIGGLCFDSRGNLYVTKYPHHFSLTGVWKYNSNGQLVLPPSPPDAGPSSDSVADAFVASTSGSFMACTLDRAGNLYIGGGSAIYKYSSDGKLLVTYSVQPEINGMDLASDQCTLYDVSYGSDNSSYVRRFDVCAGTPLEPFATALATEPSPSECRDVR